MAIFKRGSIQKSFLERNQLIIGIIATLFVVAGSSLALLMSSGVFKDRYDVTAYFSDAAGLKNGDDVIVAGLEAGTVSSVDIEDGLVAVALKIDKHVEMPRDTRAEIVVETLLGRKSVSLEGGSAQELLADGDEISIDNTRTPVELLDLANTSVPLLEESDAEALNTFLEEVTKITKGKRQELGTLVTGLADVTEAVDSRSAELKRLLDSFRTLGAAFADRDDELVSLIDNFDVVLANLEERTNDVQVLLQATDEASHEIASLVGRNRARLDSALRSLHLGLTTLDNHQSELAATISYLEQSVQGYSSVGYSQGVPNRWANIFVQSLGPLGIDAFFGPCGAFDQALDDLLGPDPRSCEDRHEYGPPDDENERDRGDDGRSERDRPREREEPPDDGGILPGDVGDMLDDVIGGVDVVDDLRGSLP